MSTVAVIDDYIDDRFFSNIPVVKRIEITPDLEVRDFNFTNESQLTHATLCAEIIHQFAPQSNFVNIKILNSSTWKSSKEQLAKALELCSEMGIRIVNLSLGSTDYRDFRYIANVVESVQKQRMIIVAAYSNINILTCPASLPNVFGVKSCKKSALSDSQFAPMYTNNDGTNFIACSNFELKNFMGHKIATSCSNSYAAPVITAVAHNVLLNSPESTFEEVKCKLNSLAIQKTVPVNSKPVKIFQHEIETPAIAFYTRGYLPILIYNQFKKEGYSVCLFTDDEQNQIKDQSIIPISSVNTENKDLIMRNTLQIIVKIYDPDIILFWFNKPYNIRKAGALSIDAIIYDASKSKTEGSYRFANKTCNHWVKSTLKSEVEIISKINSLYQ